MRSLRSQRWKWLESHNLGNLLRGGGGGTVLREKLTWEALKVGPLGGTGGWGRKKIFWGGFRTLGKVCLFVTWGFLGRGVGTTLAHGGEEEKKDPRRENGEKPLWQEEGVGIRRRGSRGRRRGEAQRGVGVRDCMTEVIKGEASA